MIRTIYYGPRVNWKIYYKLADDWGELIKTYPLKKYIHSCAHKKNLGLIDFTMFNKSGKNSWRVREIAFHRLLDIWDACDNESRTYI